MSYNAVLEGGAVRQFPAGDGDGFPRLLTGLQSVSDPPHRCSTRRWEGGAMLVMTSCSRNLG